MSSSCTKEVRKQASKDVNTNQHYQPNVEIAKFHSAVKRDEIKKLE